VVIVVLSSAINDLQFQAEARIAAFLGALFLHIAEALEQGQSQPGYDPCATINNLFKSLAVTDRRRHAAFFAVVLKAVELLDQNEKLCRLAPASDKDIIKWHKDLYKTLCLNSARRVAKLLGGQHQHVVIGFDECRHLNEATDPESVKPNTKMSLLALQRIIKAADDWQTELDHVKFWYTLLDTSSSVFDLFPRKGGGNSTRLATSLNPVAAWPYLGFDQMVPSDFRGTLTPLQACEIDVLSKYGRPVCVSSVSSVPPLMHVYV
jgi:hypothetical protein